MISFLRKILGPKEVRMVDLATADAATRASIASSARTSPEVLDYLSKDADDTVRRAVAVNRSTPVRAAALMAGDKSTDVRLALAARLVELLPDLATDQHSQLYAYAVQALGVLAQDEVLKIRKALSTALKDHAHTPPEIAARLARDVEREVSEPVLRLCISLSDDDLLDILAGHPEPWVISAIAGRETVSEAVSDAVIQTEDQPAGTVLISNPGAALSADTLQTIVDRARDCPEWHAPVALRKDLNADIAKQLAGFVNNSVLALLEKRRDFDPETRGQVAAIVGRRVAYAGKNADPETPQAKLERYFKAGALNAEVIADALAWQDFEFVSLALAFLARIHPGIAGKMLKSGGAKPVIALAWKAGMPMRLAVELQRQYAKLPPKDIIYARGGTDYPLAEDEIKWQFEFYGIDSGK